MSNNNGTIPNFCEEHNQIWCRGTYLTGLIVLTNNE